MNCAATIWYAEAHSQNIHGVILTQTSLYVMLTLPAMEGICPDEAVRMLLLA